MIDGQILFNIMNNNHVTRTHICIKNERITKAESDSDPRQGVHGMVW